MPIEDDGFLVGAYAFAKHYPPTDEAGFLEFIRTIRSPIVYDAIKNAEPVSELKAFRKPTNTLNRYDQLHSWPKGFIALGDAVASFNPIYGQGMTIAAKEAEVLRLYCQRQLDLANNSQRIQKQIVRCCAVPWLNAKIEDSRWEETEGVEPSVLNTPMQGLTDRLLRAACHDEYADKAFLAALHMTAGPAELFQPKVLYKLWQYGGQGLESAYPPDVEPSPQETA